MKIFLNNLRTGMLLVVLTAVVMGGGYVIGGRGGLEMALLMAVVMNFGGYFFSDKIALATMRAEEVGPDHELYQVVEVLIGRAGLPMPRVYVSPYAAPNAFATGRNKRHAAVCATAGLLQVLDREQLSGVMGHELGHVLHRDILIQSLAAVMAGAISFLGYMFMWGGGNRDRDGEGNPLLGLLFLILGPLAAMVVQMAISRQREYAADSEGARLCGDPMYLATALERIESLSKENPLPVNPSFNNMFIIEPLNLMGGLAGLFSTHPPLEKRLMNLIGRREV